MGGQLTGPQISEFMSIRGTDPEAAWVAYTVGTSGLTARDVGMVQFFSAAGLLAMQSGMLIPMSGDSLMATTEMPWPSSWAQYWAIPAPMSDCAAAPPAGCPTVARPSRSLVITTSGLIRLIRSCCTAAPQEWQAA